MSTTKWTIDPAHSEISFKVKHLVISTVTGYFKQFEGSAESASDDFEGASIEFKADTSSIDTNQADRDAHLKSADFFDAENHPHMEFKGKLQKEDGEYRLGGDLFVKGNAKPVELDVDFGGVVDDQYGNTRAGFEMVGTVNRKDLGLTWSAITEAGNIVVSDQVKIIANVELVKE